MLTEDGLKYNFVFLFAESDYWEAILGKELYHGKNSRVYRTAFDGNPVLQRIFHYHWAYSLNRIINLPFKSVWFKRMYEQSFHNDLPLCFVYMGGNMIRFDGGFAEYVRRRDPRNKVVIMHQDLIAKKINYDYDIIRKRADLCITYDKAEAEEYGIHYFREDVYSKIIPDGNDDEFEQDVYFLGAAKDRLQKILDAYRYFQSKGIRCKFIIADVPQDKQVQAEGIEYGFINYEDNLRNVKKSRCVLEILQCGSCDITTRALEAIAYRRKFITDCPMDLTPFFNKEQLVQYKQINEVQDAFVKGQYNPNLFVPQIDLNPIRRLYFIQQKLEEL